MADVIIVDMEIIYGMIPETYTKRFHARKGLRSKKLRSEELGNGEASIWAVQNQVRKENRKILSSQKINGMADDRSTFPEEGKS
ncbi:hypothetical protein H6P81_011742 [Aristolochia fimbriata]|uniref:Uncharacterized protein n=1 Tax=Aristolochia fimbriata TaxID=158543 RepID=A0AAV7EBI9_ARIFI|nr:hypothetical protein H6P81_011742 [Aristolochia fimbriata]